MRAFAILVSAIALGACGGIATSNAPGKGSQAQNGASGGASALGSPGNDTNEGGASDAAATEGNGGSPPAAADANTPPPNTATGTTGTNGAGAGTTTGATGVLDACTASGGRCLFGGEICTGVANTRNCSVGYCCIPAPVHCGQPDAMVYECPEAGAPVCRSAPIPPGAPGFTLSAPDDAGYAAGCIAHFPFCSGGVPYQCTCEGTSWGTFWGCF
jgi:hypothetical protein